MSNLPLQPLVWRTNNIITSTVSALHYYDISKEYNGKYEVIYHSVMDDSLAKTATGFATIDEAKAWAWNHYNEKMQPYVKPDSITNYFDNFKKWGLDRGIIQNG